MVAGDRGDEAGKRVKTVEAPPGHARDVELLERHGKPFAKRLDQGLLARPAAQKAERLFRFANRSLERRKELGGDGVGLANRPDRLDVDANRRGFREREQRYVVAVRDVEVPSVVLEAGLAVCAVRELGGLGAQAAARAEPLGQA